MICYRSNLNAFVVMHPFTQASSHLRFCTTYLFSYLPMIIDQDNGFKTKDLCGNTPFYNNTFGNDQDNAKILVNERNVESSFW